MRTIVLLRHGRTEANERRVYCGSSDLPLSEGGREELIRRRKAGAYPDIVGFRVYTSPLRRTEETLECLYGNVAYTVCPELRESDFGVFELRGFEEMKDDADYIAWCSGDNWRNVPPGGESGETMARRVTECFTRLRRQSGDLLLVTHGGPVAAIMCLLFPQEDRPFYRWLPKNGGGYIIMEEGEALSYRPIREE